jgi:hypothetical protein
MPGVRGRVFIVLLLINNLFAHKYLTVFQESKSTTPFKEDNVYTPTFLLLFLVAKRLVKDK